MFYIWERQDSYTPAIAANDEFVALGTAMVPDDTVLAMAFATSGAWDVAPTFAGGPWDIYSREIVAGLVDVLAGSVPADHLRSTRVLSLPNVFAGTADGLLGHAADGQLLIGVTGAPSFTSIPAVEVWHYRPMTDAEIVAALPLADLTAALPADAFFSAISGAYSDAINRDVQPAPTANRPAYVVINAPSS